jgi:hypothetical protein
LLPTMSVGARVSAGVDEAVREGAVLFDRDEMPLAGRRPLIARRQLA